MRAQIKLSFFVLFLSVIIFSSCKKNQSVAPSSEINYEQQYAAAVADAMVADENEIYNKLTVITEQNSSLQWKGVLPDKRVLVSTMIPGKYKSSYPEGDTINLSWSESWVTCVPEIKNWFKNNSVSQGNLTLRAQQLLGLPKREGDYFFVNMWVLPADLFRPSPDNEITDATAQLDFRTDADNDYKTWFNNNIINSYYTASGSYKYPWTRLGYTYDWGNATNEIGLSEFVVRKNSTVIIESVTALNEYLR